jgi:hypothetical protein
MKHETKSMMYSMQSPKEEIPAGPTGHCHPESSKPPGRIYSEEEKAEAAAFWAKVKKDSEKAEQALIEAIAEAKRRGVPLHYIIPVN